jgi:hypothetical protein
MCDFNNLTDEEKEHFYQLLTNCANNFGGRNFFLQLIEAIREAKAHPLCSRHQDFLSEFGTIRWGKIIFNDKVQLIEKMRKVKHENNNFLPKKEDKNYKRVLNLVRTLNPITFSVRPSLRDNGEGFDFPAFDTINSETTTINPIFDALFFCNIETVKKILNYKK